MGSSQSTKKKPYLKTVLWGIGSIALYTVLLSKQDIINKYFGLGGVVYAILPIVTAFIFSIVHGTFTSHFWTALGVEASKKHKGVK